MKVGKNMANELIQVYIDPDIEKQANDLFNRLGLDMSSAVNAFLNQCVFYGGLPFEVKLPDYSPRKRDQLNTL